MRHLHQERTQMEVQYVPKQFFLFLPPHSNVFFFFFCAISGFRMVFGFWFVIVGTDKSNDFDHFAK